MKPTWKLNGGLGATLCKECSKIISVGFTKDLYCSDKCKNNIMETKLERIEKVLQYYANRGTNKERVNEIKHKILKDDSIR